MGRKHLIESLKEFLKALVLALKSVWKFATTCPVTKMIGIIVGVIVGMIILNLAFIAAGFVVIPLLIKLIGGLLGLYGSFEYMKDTVIDIYREVKKMRAGECTTSCKKKLIEKSCAMVGAILEVILMGGIEDYVDFSKNTAATRWFKKYKIKPSQSLKNDFVELQKATKGGVIKIKSLGKSLKTKLESSSDVAKKKVKNTRKTKVDDDSVDAITKKGHTEVSADNSVDPITNKARLKKLADHTEVASVPDSRVRSFANEKFKDPDFLKKLELDKLIPTEYLVRMENTMDDVLISFKEAMLKSEHKRQQFVERGQG